MKEKKQKNRSLAILVMVTALLSSLFLYPSFTIAEIHTKMDLNHVIEKARKQQKQLGRDFEKTASQEIEVEKENVGNEITHFIADEKSFKKLKEVKNDSK